MAGITQKLNIKPLSLNSAYRGRRFATLELQNYKKAVGMLLPPTKPLKGKLELILRFGMSSKQSDIDNCVKCFMDCLADKYGFNDNKVYKLEVEKIDCKKNAEFIEFELKDLSTT